MLNDGATDKAGASPHTRDATRRAKLFNRRMLWGDAPGFESRTRYQPIWVIPPF
jgi:hypothetical protein